MKTTYLLPTCAIALLLVVASQGSVFGADKPDPAQGGSHEEAKLKVLKVFSARDGVAVYRAYLVHWKGQEVVVPDTLVKSDYHEGDIANVLVMRNPYPGGTDKQGLLGFEILPK